MRVENEKDRHIVAGASPVSMQKFGAPGTPLKLFCGC
jgi:hypothetical protein